MQASIYFPSSLPFLSTKTTSTFTKTLFPVKHDHQQCIKTSSTSISKIKATASDAPEVDYNSMQSSVFPAEACETVGGVACDVEMFPETKLKQEPKSNDKVVNTQTVDREYLQYDNPKTVFIAEACDDLGGEFCEPAYQSGDK
ncbi:light-regulated protein, chloroplastic [Bidens hawaiensis]|uniref:light-regulated protein, chloroplastic n=1 Tax=Bidens hawaiensis TaxID=980011 RepID=UPI00404AE561